MFPLLSNLRLLPAALAAILLLSQAARSGEIRLKNGTIIEGKPVPLESLNTGPKKAPPGPISIYPILMIDSPLQRYFIPARQVDATNKDIDLSKNEIFRFKQDKRSGGSKLIQSVGDIVAREPFDEHGRRTVTLQTSSGSLSVIQGITEITPSYVKVVALNYLWETAYPTSAVPDDVLDRILRNKLDQKNPDHRLAIARFYLQAEKYRLAEEELAAIKAEFYELADNVAQVQLSLTQYKAQWLLNEMKMRQAAGQHRFVYEATRAFPVENVAAPVLREVRDITAQYDAAKEKGDRIKALLGEFQAQITDENKLKEIAPLRAEIAEKLNIHTLGRLEPFLNLSGDKKLSAGEKLALALSGWVVGSENAITELDQAVRFWQTRTLLQDYLRTPVDGATERKDIVSKLTSLEGLSAGRVAQMIPLLPPARDPGEASPDRIVRIDVPVSKGESPVAYWVLLPYEYHPDHRYPLIVALHRAGRPASHEVEFWGNPDDRRSPSQRRGYIVIAPEYMPKGDQSGYDYGAASHRIVIESMRDVRKRFGVDSDRIYLSGHSSGGDAAFDIGMSHPDLFAGVIPITGVSDKFCQFYWENSKPLAFYVISGELDRDTVARNAKELGRMMQHNFDLIYTEFVGAGQESFYAEIHKLFDWMSRHRRVKLPEKIDVKTLRTTDNSFYWFEFDGIPPTVAAVDWNPANRRANRPMNASAMVTPGNTLVIDCRSNINRVWLSPQTAGGLVDFDKRLTVRVNNRPRFNDFLKPDVDAMLEHFRVHGDAQRLYWAMLEF